jgi:hypothetical protein
LLSLFICQRGNTQEESSDGGDDDGDDDFGGSRFVCSVVVEGRFGIGGECVFLVPPAHGWASLTRPQYHMTDNTARARGGRKEEEGMYQPPPPLPPQFKKRQRGDDVVGSGHTWKKRMILIAGDGVLWQW